MALCTSIHAEDYRPHGLRRMGCWGHIQAPQYSIEHNASCPMCSTAGGRMGQQ